MKKVLLLAVMAVVYLQLYSEEKFAKYQNSLIEKSYQIEIESKAENEFTLWVNAMSLDALHDKGGISIDNKQYNDFITSLKTAKEKYIEWKKVGIENNVRELIKDMKLKSIVDGFFMYGDWNFTSDVYLQYEFKILELKKEINYMLIIRTGQLQSSSNRFMKVDGFALTFLSEKEIDDFLNIISIDKINEFMKKPKAKDLFKD